MASDGVRRWYGCYWFMLWWQMGDLNVVIMHGAADLIVRRDR